MGDSVGVGGGGCMTHWKGMSRRKEGQAACEVNTLLHVSGCGRRRWGSWPRVTGHAATSLSVARHIGQSHLTIVVGSRASVGGGGRTVVCSCRHTSVLEVGIEGPALC